MKLRSPCPWGLVASICEARGSGPFLCFFGCIVRIGCWLSGVQRLDYDDHSHHHHLSSSSSSSLSFSSSSSSLVVLGNLIMQLFSCEDLSQEFGCQNYCQVKTSRFCLSVATILGQSRRITLHSRDCGLAQVLEEMKSFSGVHQYPKEY